MATASRFVRRVGATVRQVGRRRGDGGWYGPHMAAAERAILDRIPLVDLVMEIRDARIPLASAFEPLRQVSYFHKHMIVLNKVDLANHSQTKDWMKYLEMQKHICCGVNSHNKESIKELLTVVRARIRELKFGERDFTATVMLVGIPNVGKSAIVNSMHQIGRVSAEEKGKLKHAVVSTQPGETQDISGYKIASHPNIYVLDTPGILSPKNIDDYSGSKLALTGAINDLLVGEFELAQYLLSVLNSAEEYKLWENLETAKDDQPSLSLDNKGNDSKQQGKRQYSSDHTQDFVVRDVRQTLSQTISLFKMDLDSEDKARKLIEAQFTALREAFRLPCELGENDNKIVVAQKLLNLYRIGRLGRYTLDLSSRSIHIPVS